MWWLKGHKNSEVPSISNIDDYIHNRMMNSLSLWNPRSAFAGFDDDFFADNFFHQPFGVPSTSALARSSRNLHSPSRGFEVTESDKQVQLAIDVPGVKHDNLMIELENDGRVLHLSGGRKDKTDTSYEEYKFDRRITIGKTLDASKITAHLNNGVLTLTAPKKEEVPAVKQEIPIIQGEAPALIGSTSLTKNASKL
jgi:HSP20 family protein